MGLEWLPTWWRGRAVLFCDITRSIVEVVDGVKTEEDVKAAVDKAATLAPEESLAIEQAGAMVVFSLANISLANFLVSECGRQGVPCINFMESAILAIEQRLQLPRGSEDVPDEPCETIFAVSDTSAEASYRIACKAFKQFPNVKLTGITCCPGIKSLQEIDHIVQEALKRRSLIIYTLASPGMSRFMRQQCERAKVLYADVLQPVVIALERYLDYPPVGVPGGHYSKEDELSAKTLEVAWEEKPMIA
ncbi:Putative pyruvate [Durusdinium trenchii]|uniref:Phosphate dikinase regulatory protein (PPDK regulatory protein) n=1 Tax=Durusdinium trenchii TaxID=1381693 RepID=A0ABP0Q902_9DINO